MSQPVARLLKVVWHFFIFRNFFWKSGEHRFRFFRNFFGKAVSVGSLFRNFFGKAVSVGSLFRNFFGKAVGFVQVYSVRVSLNVERLFGARLWKEQKD